jgi:hypothetical protein
MKSIYYTLSSFYVFMPVADHDGQHLSSTTIGLIKLSSIIKANYVPVRQAFLVNIRNIKKILSLVFWTSFDVRCLASWTLHLQLRLPYQPYVTWIKLEDNKIIHFSMFSIKERIISRIFIPWCKQHVALLIFFATLHCTNSNYIVSVCIPHPRLIFIHVLLFRLGFPNSIVNIKVAD